MDFNQINSLSALLSESREAKKPSTDGNVKQAINPNVATNSIAVLTREQIQEKKLIEEANKKSKNEIWDTDAIPEQEDVRDIHDSRPSPFYEISYKQLIGTEDSFLGMGDKSPASQDCSHIVVKIHFPGSKLKDLDVDVKKNRISAESKTLKLFTYLPVAVDHDNGKAQFDSAKCILTVTIPILKEFNF